jgi:Raf kinase inhibitor-like YbhB/YbcL family protein
MGMVLRSPAFPDFGWMPDRYTSEPHVSPPLVWWDVPRGAESLALVCDDLEHADDRCFRWALCDIPAQKRSIVEGYPAIVRLSVACQGANDFGSIGYYGPCPDGASPTHHRRFRLFALGIPTLGLISGASCQAIFARALDSAVEVAQLVGARPSYTASATDQVARAAVWDGSRPAASKGPEEPAAPGRVPS